MHGRTPRLMGYAWSSPNTALALAIFAALAPFGARGAVVDGVIEVRGRVVGQVLRRLPLAGIAQALTLGHVVFAETEMDHARSRRHERVHVGQYARWGPFFLPAYVACSLWERLNGRDPYRHNHFEREAYASEHG